MVYGLVTSNYWEGSDKAVLYRLCSFQFLRNLLWILSRGNAADKLQGIQLDLTHSIWFTLFEDDLGMSVPATELAFGQTRAALNCYEKATGAKLNLWKPVVIPINAMEVIPIWLQETRCKLSGVGEVQQYLGAPFRLKLSVSQQHCFCLDRIGGRLSAWSTHFLSFTGRVLLVKHVLQAIPIYHMMFLRSSEVLARKIISLSRVFLWGQNEIGGQRIPLVAWEWLSRPKIEGGLGLRDFKCHSDVLLSKWPVHWSTG